MYVFFISLCLILVVSITLTLANCKSVTVALAEIPTFPFFSYLSDAKGEHLHDQFNNVLN